MPPTKTPKTQSVSSTLPVAPHDLPDDGTPVVFTTSFAKQVGNGGRVEEDKLLDVEDFEDAEWEVRKQTPDGWEFLERVEGMPLDHDLREDYGAGKYEVYPIDPRSGKPVKQLRKVRLISAAIGNPGGVVQMPGTRPADDFMGMPMPLGGPTATDEMPAWMRWQMQQAAEERAEQRRRADDAAARQAAFEEKLALREFERQEREERQKEAERKQAEGEAQRRDERFNTLITAGLGLVQAFVVKQSNPAPQKDVNEVLLRELMEERRSRSQTNNSMRDNVELLLVLDKLAEARASRVERGRDDDDDEGDDMMKTMLTSMLPSILAGRSGGGGGGAPQLPPEMVDKMIEQAFQSPELIGKIAMRNPTGIAKSFMAALKANPALESAVLEAIDKESGDDED